MENIISTQVSLTRGYVCAISYKCAWLLLLTTARDSGSRPISVFLVWAVAEWLCGGSYSYDEQQIQVVMVGPYGGNGNKKTWPANTAQNFEDPVNQRQEYQSQFKTTAPTRFPQSDQ